MNEVQNFYNANVQREWDRLNRHRTEFGVTLRALRDHLLPPPASVIDIGGGPGRYAIELARQGYSVTLVDLSENNLAFAREKAREAGVSFAATIHANALDLAALPDDSFDAVLLMGPLYHLQTAKERLQAALEAARVLKPDGLIAAAFVTRFAGLRFYAAEQPEEAAAIWDLVLHLADTGIDLDPGEGFPGSYFAHPDEAIPLMESVGFETIRLVGCEGIVAAHEEKINQLTGDAWNGWVDLNYRLGLEPTLYGASDHLLYIGRRPSAPTM